MLSKNLFLTVAIVFCGSAVFAQGAKKPAASPRQVITQDFGLSKITIDYSRPGVKGRTIFGDLEPFGKVWRAGANAVTTIDFGQDVKLEGHEVKAGKYALFAIPNEKEWTIILNKDIKNWGTDYKEADDVLRFDVPSYQVPINVETFTINIDSLRDTSATIYLLWQHTYVPIHVTTTLAGQTGINKALKQEKGTYVAAFGYAVQDRTEPK